MTLNKEYLGWIRKFITALVGAAGIIITQGLIEGTAAKWVAIGIALATALGVGIIPNGSAPSTSGASSASSASPSSWPTV
jgi:hypothetical protein